MDCAFGIGHRDGRREILSVCPSQRGEYGHCNGLSGPRHWRDGLCCCLGLSTLMRATLMRKTLFTLILALLLPSAAMAQQNRAGLTNTYNTDLPTNGHKLIT